MKSFFLSLWVSTKKFNFQLISAIDSFLKSYIPKNSPYFASLIPKFFQIGFYTLFLIIIFALLKLWYHENKVITFVLVGLLIIAGASILGIFAGFIQLTFTF